MKQNLGPYDGGVVSPEPFWHAIRSTHRDLLSSLGTAQAHEPGAVIVREHDRADQALVVLDGCVKVSGADRAPVLREAGELVGERACVDGSARSATVVAVTSAGVLLLPGRALRSYLDRHRDVAAVLRRTIAARGREADQRRTCGGAALVPQRLAALLLRLGARYGSPAAGGAVLIGLPLALTDLAGLVLTSQRTLAGVLDAWTTEGVITTGTGRRTLTLLHPDVLRTIANGV
jgi:CRP/FNR family transcriptional regulator, cyclic AMP receptor protein